MILLDTHVLIWLDEGSPRLGKNALQQINKEFEGGVIAVSAISFWEISMLVQKQRLEIQLPLDDWRGELIQSGIQEIPVDGSIAICAGGLQNFHDDPADRLIVSTALKFESTLVTADQKILSWKDLKLRVDANL
ncbi:MAG: type II toxin-antitoxin system VapC family toxin [Proteobacteria bacterium]|nr:type II toxin-antitoxin system VapC family toxin [Pseudomonadota bacterium]MBU4469124.1 type II toxin-antitoxin system VapC family toxin [Pseudomonadota bacterium]MCG2752155.1 type II toxin-antitoxin system VapC family toxin [Desulfobacteraceae bacterium]